MTLAPAHQRHVNGGLVRPQPEVRKHGDDSPNDGHDPDDHTNGAEPTSSKPIMTSSEPEPTGYCTNPKYAAIHRVDISDAVVSATPLTTEYSNATAVSSWSVAILTKMLMTLAKIKVA
eukprot:CAMPEP_0174708862 /NCGR_PEP_ID=MMETSP1094-20130205/11001_1 /TAXON_ID=156173 /ORGANISM="Chrysochromulina brevifilum, Strain UTEX LB 985" /LENGTH=117 /DNA_ID=CAMNT_0015907475 /DNA_START=57 /DNA_END=408 /DNA_ORIENTATION=-